jgi:hypothetical protein
LDGRGCFKDVAEIWRRSKSLSVWVWGTATSSGDCRAQGPPLRGQTRYMYTSATAVRRAIFNGFSKEGLPEQVVLLTPARPVYVCISQSYTNSLSGAPAYKGGWLSLIGILKGSGPGLSGRIGFAFCFEFVLAAFSGRSAAGGDRKNQFETNLKLNRNHVETQPDRNVSARSTYGGKPLYTPAFPPQPPEGWRRHRAPASVLEPKVRHQELHIWRRLKSP